MSPTTRLALGMLAAFTGGLALIVVGVWPNYKLGAAAAGVVLGMGAPVMFAAIWKSR